MLRNFLIFFSVLIFQSSLISGDLKSNCRKNNYNGCCEEACFGSCHVASDCCFKDPCCYNESCLDFGWGCGDDFCWDNPCGFDSCNGDFGKGCFNPCKKLCSTDKNNNCCGALGFDRIDDGCGLGNKKGCCGGIGFNRTEVGLNCNKLAFNCVRSLEDLFLSDKHPLKKKLDKIFKKRRATASIEELNESDFYVLSWAGDKHPIVARHPALRGYVIKLFVDTQNVGNGYEHFARRVRNAREIACYIEENGFGNFFKTPEKWLYKIKDADEETQVAYLLIAKDVKPLSPNKNKQKWKRRNFGQVRLESVFEIIDTLGLFDSVYIDNIPFCEDGKIAIIDTEHLGKWPVNFSKLTPVFHPSLQIKWLKLIECRRTH